MCSLCGGEPAWTRTLGRRCYQRLWRRGLLDELTYPKRKRPRADYGALVEDYLILRANGHSETTMPLMAEKLGVHEMTLYRALKAVSYEW
jgi:hypothetical protein